MVTAYGTVSAPYVSRGRDRSDPRAGRKRGLFAAGALFLVVLVSEAIFIAAAARTTIADGNALSTFYISPP